jgi:Undecaprenyl-phosphate galactose phosphotransferase WbaP
MSLDELDAMLAKRRYRGGGALPTVIALILTDLFAILGSFGTGFFIINCIDADIIDFKSFVTYWPYLPCFLVVFAVASLYPGLSLAPAEELKRFTLTSLLGHAGIILSMWIQGHRLDAYSIAFALSWIISVPAFTVCRAIVRALCKNSSWWGMPVVVFGAGKTGKAVVDRLIARPAMGYKPVVILDDDPEREGEYHGVPILCGTELGPEIADRCGIDTAIVAMPGVERDRLAAIIADKVGKFQDYILVPDYIGMTSIWISVRDFDGILGLYTSQRLLKKSNVAVKRVIDVALCLIGGLILSPFLLLACLLIKLDSRGPAFYGHGRLGLNGEPFVAWKFRTMVRDSDAALEKILASDPEKRLEWEANHKLRDDPRITRMGRFLRRTSLDELPQIWNVIKGEMSLIGPRPIVEAEVPKYGIHYKLFSSVKPGMSGLWQVSGRSDIDYAERVALDVYYIQSWSLWLDIHILFRTVAVVLWGRGAY